MGRKIPARKHKGVKDPMKQMEARFASIKNKINHPPTDPDEQAIPKRFLLLKKRIEIAKQGKPKKRPTKIHKDKELIDTRKFRETEVNLPGMRRPEKPIPVFKQLPGEEGHQFVHRIQLKCQEVINECNFEDKFKVNVNRNAESGEVESINKLPKDDIAFLKFLTPPGQNKEKKNRSATNREKRKQKALDKAKAKKERKVDEFAKYRDEVKFGEVVHGPPELNILPRKSSKVNDSKPGRRDLLLKELLPAQKAEPRASVFEQKPRKDKKKQKTLPIAEQRIREAQRIEAVEAYRMIKAKRMKQSLTLM